MYAVDATWSHRSTYLKDWITYEIRAERPQSEAQGTKPTGFYAVDSHNVIVKFKTDLQNIKKCKQFETLSADLAS